MNIHEAVYCIVDIETTGLDPVTDRIVEIACVATSAYGVLGMWASLVDGRPCNPKRARFTDSRMLILKGRHWMNVAR